MSLILHSAGINYTSAPSSCPPLPSPTQILPSGQYKISFIDHTGTNKNTLYYFSALRGNPAAAIANPLYDPNNALWTYDSKTKLLSTACLPKFYVVAATDYVGLVLLSTDVSKATPVLLTQTSIRLPDPTYSIFPSYRTDGKIIQVQVCSQASTSVNGFTVQLMTTDGKISSPPVPSGYYRIASAKNNYMLNGTGELDSNPDNAATWNYDNKTNTLRLGNDQSKCLLNIQLDHCTPPTYFVGSCTNTDKAQRFVLTTDGQLYDPLLKSCITFPTVSQ